MDRNGDVHRVETKHDGHGGYWWECGCGIGGSGPDATKADEHSGRHIQAEGGTRIDVHRTSRY